VSVTTYRSKRRASETPEPDGKVAEKKVNLSGAPRAAMPTNIAPMLAGRAEKAFDHPDWIFEIKWDGYRAIAEVQRGSVRLYSRNHLSSLAGEKNGQGRCWRGAALSGLRVGSASTDLC
jgi:ATP-dependent DNA ligase